MNPSALVVFMTTNLLVTFFTVYYLIKVLRRRGQPDAPASETSGDQKN